jgi:hypothetical protein
MKRASVASKRLMLNLQSGRVRFQISREDAADFYRGA